MQEIENSIWCICLDFTPNLAILENTALTHLSVKSKGCQFWVGAKEEKTQQCVQAVNMLLFLVHNGVADSMVLDDS